MTSSWKHIPPYWPFARGLHWSPVNSPHKGQWRGALIVFFDLRLNKRLSKQSWSWWFETPSRSLWRHCKAFWKLDKIKNVFLLIATKKMKSTQLNSAATRPYSSHGVAQRRYVEMYLMRSILFQLKSNLWFMMKTDLKCILITIRLIWRYPAGKHLVPKTSSRQRFQDVQNVNSENVHKELSGNFALLQVLRTGPRLHIKTVFPLQI